MGSSSRENKLSASKRDKEIFYYLGDSVILNKESASRSKSVRQSVG